MRKLIELSVVLALMVTAGCATRVSVAPTHRENMAAQAKVLAITARNLEDSVHRHRAEAAEEEAARAVADFHAGAENFAGTTARWLSDDRVNSDYERLIDAWVKVKQTFPNLKSDNLTQDAYERVQHEWEKLARTSGYAGRKYQQKVEQGK
jgi:outer membrane murein-binding lipoprotein Lpp